MTVHYFQLLKSGQEEPDENIDQAIDSIDSDALTPIGIFYLTCLHYVDILGKVPGVSNANILLLMDKVRSLYEMSKKPLPFFVQVMGAVNGSKLYNFINADTSKYENLNS